MFLLCSIQIEEQIPNNRRGDESRNLFEPFHLHIQWDECLGGLQLNSASLENAVTQAFVTGPPKF
jgi:hypothetical protein